MFQRTQLSVKHAYEDMRNRRGRDQAEAQHSDCGRHDEENNSNGQHGRAQRLVGQ